MTGPGAQAEMNRQLYRLIFSGDDRPVMLGELIMRAKAQVSEPDVRRTWILLGDPTMKIR
jgi:hypothetical protein